MCCAIQAGVDVQIPDRKDSDRGVTVSGTNEGVAQAKTLIEVCHLHCCAVPHTIAAQRYPVVAASALTLCTV
jgi:KH domain-containing protein